MRVVWELVAAFVGALLVFVLMIGSVIGAVVVFVFYLISALMLLVSLFSGVGFLFTHSRHTLLNALVYFGYAAVAFAIPMTFAHVPYLIGDTFKRRRQEKMSLERIGALRIASDASFHDSGRWPQSHASK